MTAELVARSLLPDPVPGLTFTPTALVVEDPQLSYEAFEDAVRAVGGLGDGVRWWLGDLLLFGEGRYGERHAQVLDFARVGEHTLNRYRRVCERISRGRRRTNLSFSHHDEVAKLERDDQETLLDRAEQRGMTVAELREAVRDLAALEPKSGQLQVLPAAGQVVAAADLVTVKDAFRTIYQHLRDPAAVDAVAAAETIPAALRAVERCTETLLDAEARRARPPLLDAATAVVAEATHSAGFAIIPEPVFDEFAAAVAAEKEAP